MILNQVDCSLLFSGKTGLLGDGAAFLTFQCDYVALSISDSILVWSDL